MKERPILMNGAMVRATLSGAKTQTRRLMKTQLVVGDVCGMFRSWCLPNKAGTGGLLYPNAADDILATCPHGQPRDRLWVRETCWIAAGATDLGGVLHCAEHPCLHMGGMKKRPSIHMPRWASRILLEIVSIRVDRLQQISTEDIIAEGLSTTLREHDAELDLRDQWRKLWESTGGDWDSNPWLWVIEFKRVTP